jgi:hypothetical protein
MADKKYPQVKVTQVVSKNGSTKRQIANLRSLGLHRMNQTVVLEKNPVVAGMITKVQHLVAVEEI